MTASLAELLGDNLATGNSFTQTNLVSDGTVPAATIDPNLINPWGMSEFSPAGPIWISDNNAGVTTFYQPDGTKDGQVAIAPPLRKTGAGTPTGQVFNAAGTGSTLRRTARPYPPFSYSRLRTERSPDGIRIYRIPVRRSSPSTIPKAAVRATAPSIRGSRSAQPRTALFSTPPTSATARSICSIRSSSS
jgi:hypothetical protein